MSDYSIDKIVDITSYECPATFVAAKASLEEAEPGNVLAIRLNEGESVQNLPRSIKDEGHLILRLIDNCDGSYDLIVRRGEY